MTFKWPKHAGMTRCIPWIPIGFTPHAVASLSVGESLLQSGNRAPQ